MKIKVREYEGKSISNGNIVNGQLLRLAFPCDKKLYDSFYIVTGSQIKHHGLWIAEKIRVYADSIKEI